MHPGKAVWLVVLVVVMVAVGWWVWRQYFDNYHLAVVREGVLYRDGVRSRQQFEAAVRKVKPKTVVCLVDDREIATEPFVGEFAVCKERGIEVVRIPIALGGWPQDDQVRQFLAVTADAARQPVLVHCAQGVRRTGMMVAAYQESVLKYDRDRAKAEILAFGHSRRTVGDVERFIDLYDAQGKKMTQTPPPSSE